MTKYSDQFVLWLKEMGYTHCFFVSGGNIMHLLESASQVFTCIPVVHEVTAGIAAEFFNESAKEGEGRAFAMVTAGPGLTNIITAMAGAYLESRDLLVVGGQVKSSDLRSGGLRQKGIQEIDGITLVKSICVETLQIRERVSKNTVKKAVQRGITPRKGPVFIEFCLDIQGAPAIEDEISEITPIVLPTDQPAIEKFFSAFVDAKRPVLLLGGGVSRETSKRLKDQLATFPIPVMTTWNATDRISSDAPSYIGRPNTWGQRHANILIQQSDFVIAVGTRLGMQQTGFNWPEFTPFGKLVQVEIDPSELKKENPKVDFAINHDANDFLNQLVDRVGIEYQKSWEDWFSFCRDVRNKVPLSDPQNSHAPGFIDPYDFMLALSEQLIPGDTVVPSSSGASETVAMQSIQQKEDTTVITTKGLASMGYGLGGAIGCAVRSGRRVLHIEGDGGFAQNLQDLGTVSNLQLPIKTFILCNDGYASIRMTQKSYFDGHYVGCDPDTGLGLPNWIKLFGAFDIPVLELDADNPFSPTVIDLLNAPGPAAFLVPVDPEQSYFPKITSQLTKEGGIVSNPLHLMSPPLPHDVHSDVFRFL